MRDSRNPTRTELSKPKVQLDRWVLRRSWIRGLRHSERGERVHKLWPRSQKSWVLQLILLWNL